MEGDQQWRECPDVVIIEGGDGSITLRKRGDLYAVKGQVPDDQRAHVMMTLPGDDIAIVADDPTTAGVPAGRLLPVYRGESDEDLAVLTPRLFLRLHEGDRVAELTGEVAAMGLRVVEILAYAPNAAWLEPASGRVADGLARLDELRALPGVVNAEPQVLRQRAWKSPPSRQPGN